MELVNSPFSLLFSSVARFVQPRFEFNHMTTDQVADDSPRIAQQANHVAAFAPDVEEVLK